MANSGRNYWLTKDQKVKILILRAQGLTYPVIAERMGVTAPTARHVCMNAKKVC